jgi:hypothetical protein
MMLKKTAANFNWNKPVNFLRQHVQDGGFTKIENRGEVLAILSRRGVSNNNDCFKAMVAWHLSLQRWLLTQCIQT